jgi:two-component system sensor histidine kinase UhpB
VVFSPGTVDSPFAPRQLAILAVALCLILALSVVLTARITIPLDDLVAGIRDLDPLRRGQRLSVPGSRSSEARELANAFDDLLQRLADERELSARRTLNAQESERLRVAQELHDEVGQNLTAALLQLSRVRKSAPEPLRTEIGEVLETVRENLEELRRIAQRLRPQALEELGLASALTEFADRFAAQAGLDVSRSLDEGTSDLTNEEELVIYRVAQEALTNVARHAKARRAELVLTRTSSGELRLKVADDGVGLGGAEPGAGIQGMHERAAAIHAELEVADRDGGGTEVSLRVPGIHRA